MGRWTQAVGVIAGMRTRNDGPRGGGTRCMGGLFRATNGGATEVGGHFTGRSHPCPCPPRAASLNTPCRTFGGRWCGSRPLTPSVGQGRPWGAAARKQELGEEAGEGAAPTALRALSPPCGRLHLTSRHVRLPGRGPPRRVPCGHTAWAQRGGPAARFCPRGHSQRTDAPATAPTLNPVPLGS